MAKRKTDDNQLTIGSYSLPEKRVRLQLMDGDALYSTSPMDSPSAAVKVMADLLRQMDREYCCTVSLNGGLQPISWSQVSIGGINSAEVPIVNVFKTAILQNAAAVMLLHNHPSTYGNSDPKLQPSQEDLDLTRRLCHAGNLLGIPVMDHVIVGSGTGKIYSIRSEHPEFFREDHSFVYETVRINKSPIRYFAAENMEYHAGAYKENLSLEEAISVYRSIPPERMNAGRGIGVMLDDGSIYSGPIDLMCDGTICKDYINSVPHLRNSLIVQTALRQLETAMHQSETIHDPAREYNPVSRRDKVKDLTDQLEKGVQDVFRSNKYKEWLKTAARFTSYSVSNQILIMLQNPEATCVAGYKAWQVKFHRHVNKGEKAIAILAPTPYKKHVKEKDEKTGEEIETTVQAIGFRPAYVWDISQTSGQDLPSLVTELKGDVEGYQDLFKAIERIAPVPVFFESMHGEAKGYYSDSEQRIVIKSGMDDMQNIKTLLHEITHARLHNTKQMKENPKDRDTKEVEAESTAYVVATALGLKGIGEEYSFGYIAGWSSDKDVPELKASMETIRQTASQMIDEVQDNLKQIQQEHEQERQEQLSEQISDVLSQDGKYEGHYTKDDAANDLQNDPAGLAQRLIAVTAAGLTAKASGLAKQLKAMFPSAENLTSPAHVAEKNTFQDLSMTK